MSTIVLLVITELKVWLAPLLLNKRYLIYSLFLLNLAVVLMLWWQGSAAWFLSGQLGQTLVALGRLAGLLGAYLILTQVLLISRWPFIEREYGFDKLNALHRRLGLYLGFSLIIHPLLLTTGYALLRDIPLWQQFLDLISAPLFRLALIGLIIIISAVIATRSFIYNRLKYEVWHSLHLFIYLGLGLIVGHQFFGTDLASGWPFYYWLALNFFVGGILLFYRWLKPFLLYYRHRFYVEKLVAETHDVTSVYIRGRNLDQFKFQAGQYLHVFFLTPGLRQPHPFSLSHEPGGQFLRLSIKAIGDFSRDIPHKLKPGTKVILEGPLGRFTQAAANKQDKYLLLAGGIGITPLRSLFASLAAQNKDVILIYGNKTEKDIVFKNELAQINRPQHHVLSEEGGGHIDLAKIKRLVPDFLAREIYLCGPAPMMDSLIAALTQAGFPKGQLHYEVFRY